MKALKRTISIFAMLGALLELGVMTASAQGPVANLNPLNAPYIDNQLHPIQAGASAWYRFDYAVNFDTGEKPVTTITLPNGFLTGVAFQVWSANGVADMANNSAAGRGSPATVPINGVSTQTADLKWVGAFGSNGPYYVRVTNTSSSDVSAQLIISGDGVRLAPIAVTSATTTQSGSASDDPAKAVALDGKSQTIPANAVQWYSFNYLINTNVSASVHPVVRIQLLNGNVSGLGFQVYAPEIMGNWWMTTPLGNGTVTSTTSSDGTLNLSPNLNWSGAFGASGTYYVRVINNMANPVPATLTIQVIN
ncbi:MAG TPA: hypothetical protein VF478_06865 [Anaerolineae bacterium]